MLLPLMVGSPEALGYGGHDTAALRAVATAVDALLGWICHRRGGTFRA
jgi:hypothetical protein